MTTPLHVLDGLPDELVDCEAARLSSVLGGPTLLRLGRGTGPALFLSVLLHGNETSGWDGARQYLRDHGTLGRPVDLFIANVAAAAHSVRVLPGQQDFNRIWFGTHGPEGALAAALHDAVAGREYFAAVDLHNNTGHNPYYSVLTEVTAANCGLALAFSDKAVLVEEPNTTLTHWFSTRCPAITLETGPVGDPRCAARVYDYIDRCLDGDEIEPADASRLDLYQALARVHVPADIDLAFAGDARTQPLVLTGGVEAVNFHELPGGAVFATTERALGDVLSVLDPRHRDVTEQFFVQVGNEIRLRTAVIPAMYTTDPFVIRQDCLCYFMTRLSG